MLAYFLYFIFLANFERNNLSCNLRMFQMRDCDDKTQPVCHQLSLNHISTAAAFQDHGA